MEDCVFCKIINKELPSTIRFEDEDLIVFDNIKPVAPVHVLIVPKKHIKNLSEVEKSDQELLGRLLLIAKEMATKLGVIEGFRIAVANGKSAEQSIFHLHFHLTGGWKKMHDRGEDKA
jgi:histidine triad (HIT) family protein